MLCSYNINHLTNKNELINKFKKDWQNPKKKVFNFKSKILMDDVKTFYFNFLNGFGNFHKLAEDARIKDRNKQKTYDIWMEVRYDPKIKNAYRHSSNAQPLHTDGSYIPSYPSSTLMCCEQNTSQKGETTFIDAKKIAEILKKNNLNLFNKINNRILPHERSGEKRISPILKKISQEVWEVNWNYYCVSLKIDDEEKKIKEEFHEFLKNDLDIRKNIIELKMNRGDALIWKDQEVLHGRNSFIAEKDSARFIWKCAVNF